MNRKGRFTGVVVLVFVGLAAFFVTGKESRALPMFARKYQTGCNTCHEMFPRLSATGEAFRLNGYKFPDDEMYIKDEPVEMGDEAYKKLWPKAVWPTDIPGLPPIAVRAILDYNMFVGGPGPTSNTFTFPDEIELFGAGAFGNNISYFVEIEFEGGESEANAWIQFEDLIGPENAVNVKVGVLGMQEFGPFTARDHNRLTRNHYLYGDWRMPVPAGFATPNTYRLRSEQPGVEVNGFGRWWRYVTGIVEGDPSISDKDYFGQFSVKIGGRGFDGSGAKQGDKLPTGGEFWRDDSVIFSLFAYHGTAAVNHDGALMHNRRDQFWRIGPAVKVKYKDFAVGGGYLYGNNSRPYGALTRTGTTRTGPWQEQPVRSHTWFIEGEYFVLPWLVPSVRYEELNLDNMEALGLSNQQDRGQIIASVKAQIRSNVTLTAEGRFATYNELFTHTTPPAPKGDTDDGNMVVLRLDFAF